MKYRRIRRFAALLMALAMLGGIAESNMPLRSFAEEMEIVQDVLLDEMPEDVVMDAAAELSPEQEDAPQEEVQALPEGGEAEVHAENAESFEDMNTPVEPESAPEATPVPTEEPAPKNTPESTPEPTPEPTEQAVPVLNYSYSVRKTRDPLAETALPIIISNEGNYSAVNADDNGALSVGKIQWHAGRALSLMRRIVALNPEQAYEILGLELYNEITDTGTSWSTRTVNSSEKALLSALLGTEEGKHAQDEQALDDVSGYLEHGREKGLVSEGALIYFADVENQNGAGGSGRIANAAIEYAGSAKRVTLEIIHQISLADSKVGRYATRRNRTYNKILALGLKEVDGPAYTAAPTPAATPTPSAPPQDGEGIRITNVAYPSTYVINGVGYTVSSGRITSDVPLTRLTVDIQNAAGKSVSGMPRSWQLSGYDQKLSAFDEGITFSRISQPGDYIWIITAEDSAGRIAELKLRFKAVRSGSLEEDSASSETSRPTATATPKPTSTPKPTATPVPVPVSSIELNSENLSLQLGEVAALIARVYPENADDARVRWQSENPAVASVLNGFVTAEGAGETTIICSSADGNARAECRVVVAALPEKISIVTPKEQLFLGSSVPLEVKFYPEGSSALLQWSSSNPALASVDENGLVTGEALGSAVIRVKSENGLSASIRAKVADPSVVTAVTLQESGTLSVNIGQSLQLHADVTPAVSAAKLKWSSSNSQYAAVDQDGLVLGRRAGTATITVKSENGKKDTVKVRVVNPKLASAVVLEEEDTIKVNLGDVIQLHASVEPETAETQLKWSSSASKTAAVNQQGQVLARKTGTATITVKTENGKKDTVKVRVVNPKLASAVVLEEEGMLNMDVGEILQLHAAVEPETAETQLKWSSSASKTAAVNQQGQVLARKTGTATITVKTENGKKDTVKIRVR